MAREPWLLQGGRVLEGKHAEPSVTKKQKKQTKKKTKKNRRIERT